MFYPWLIGAVLFSFVAVALLGRFKDELEVNGPDEVLPAIVTTLVACVLWPIVLVVVAVVAMYYYVFMYGVKSKEKAEAKK